LTITTSTTITIMDDTLTDINIIVIVVMIRHNCIYHDYRCHLSSIIVIIVALTHDHLNISFSIVESNATIIVPFAVTVVIKIHNGYTP